MLSAIQPEGDRKSCSGIVLLLLIVRPLRFHPTNIVKIHSQAQRTDAAPPFLALV